MDLPNLEGRTVVSQPVFRQSLFRKAALERLSTPEQLDQAVRVTAPAGWIGLVALVALVLGAILWGILGSAPVKVPAQGILLSPTGVLDIVSETQGRISSLLVYPGAPVRRGQVVARIAQPDLEQQLATARAELGELQMQRQKVAAFQERENTARAAVIDQRRANAEQSIGFLRARLEWLGEREAFEKTMLKRGQITRQRHIDTKIEINTVNEAISRAENTIKEAALEERSSSIARERELLELDLRIESTRREIANLADQLGRKSTLRSPYAGRVVEVKANEGEIVTVGLALLSLLPDDPASGASAELAEDAPIAGDSLIAVLYAAPADGKKIQPGMPVQVSPASVKREEYGFILGTVESVAEIPSTAAGMQRILKNPRLVETLIGDGAPFQVIVRLRRDPSTPSGFLWSSSGGPDVDIDPGTLCEANIAVRDVRLISLAIPALEPLLSDPPAAGAAPEAVAGS
ncbi:NHLP bacteriocin system secretion protein [Marinibaculum pumilum]|uniref:NHLP bacteriocin system secretion protein n=1 Tax=Marinibaculum pumilum TaxID=1766165 RepID=A0ABV7L8S0_9PROT